MSAELSQLEVTGAPARWWKPYPAYKDSGVEWLGEVPDGWIIKRIGIYTKSLTGFAFESELFSYDDEHIKLVRGDNVTTGKLRWGDKTRYWSEISKDLERYLLEENDIVIGMDGSKVGKNYAIVKEEDLPLILVQRVARLRCMQSLIPSFVYYSIANDMFSYYVNITKTDPAIPHITLKNIRDYPICFPSLPEQCAIASFLDRQTAHLDALISKKERLIALLEEKRAALISSAVTKGLEPDVPMKDSGVEWLGKVPEHWEVKKLKWNLDFLNTKRIPLSSEQRADIEKIYPYYGASGIIDYVDNYIFDEDLILIAEDGANLLYRSTPLAFLATGKYWVNNHAHILKPKNGCLNFWMYSTGSFVFDPFITGSAQPKLSKENLGSIEFATPLNEEQRAIASFLDHETARIDALISKVREGIEKLHEYRTALISATVTGKIDVREAVG